MSLPLNIDDRAEADRIWNYPYAAVEEALANAVYHRSYEPCAPVEVTITPTQLEISSLPGMDRSITDADLKKCTIRSRFYRNRRIGEFLKELDLAEGRNMGIGKIVRAMHENGSPDTQFYNPETRSFMTVILPIHEAFKEAITEKKSETVVESVEKSVEKILRHLSINPFATQNELAVVTGLSVRGVEKNHLRRTDGLRRPSDSCADRLRIRWLALRRANNLAHHAHRHIL